MGRGTLRIHFLPEDLARTHVAVAPDALWETVLSLQLLHNGEGRLLFQAWRRLARARAARTAEAILLTLSPPTGVFADFLTPAAGTLGLDAGVDAVCSTPRSLIRRDLEHLAVDNRLPTWSRRLADGEPRILKHLAGALRSWHTTAVAPYQEYITASLDADRAIRLRDARLGGPERVLAGLPPPLRWEPPVLVTPYPADRDVYLDGRGLLLVPSFFCWRLPVTLIEPSLPPVLVYPVGHDLEWLRQGPDMVMRSNHQALAGLLGATRAAVLDTVGLGPNSTTGIARKMRISVSSVSEHATVLREAGLIATYRTGNAVLHSLTGIGAALLNHHC